MHAREDPPASDETADAWGGWKDVARVTFRHHVRGPWFVAAAAVGLLAPLVFLLGRAFAPALFGGQPPLARDVLPGLSFFLRDALPILLVLLVLPTFRGAWLRDPSAAAARVGGFFAGTWAAAALALVPWTLAAFVLAAWKASAWSATLGTLLYLGALLMLAGVWIAVALLLAVAFRHDETRWTVAAVALVAMTIVVPTVLEVVGAAWWFGPDVPADGPPGWASLLALLDPGALFDRFTGSVVSLSTGESTSLFQPPAAWYHPGVYALGLAAWVGSPLLSAIALQRRAAETPRGHGPD